MKQTQKLKGNLLKLVDYADPVLRRPTEPVEFPLSEVDQQLIADMIYSIHPKRLAEAGAPWEQAVGMAANQWGKSKSIFLFCPDGEVNKLEVIINPSYKPIMENDAQDVVWEGCFSVPLAAGQIKRYTKILVNYQNEQGKHLQRTLTGWPARVWQHENDHLMGILYDDIMAGKCLDKRVFDSKEAVEDFYHGHGEAG